MVSLLIISAFVFGALFAVIGVLRLYGHLWLYITVLVALGSVLQATAQVKFFVRVYLLLTEGHWPGSPRKRFPKMLASLFVVLAAIPIAIRIVVVGPFVTDWITELIITWTVMTFLSASIGAYWQLRYLRHHYQKPLFVGMVLLFAGVHVYNLNRVQTLTVQLVGWIAGTIGFWFAGWLSLREIQPRARRADDSWDDGTSGPSFRRSV